MQLRQIMLTLGMVRNYQDLHHWIQPCLLQLVQEQTRETAFEESYWNQDLQDR